LFVVQSEVTMLAEVRLIKCVMPSGRYTLTPVTSEVICIDEHLLGHQLALDAAPSPAADPDLPP